MAKSLVIVESPAKAKTIGKYLGKQFIVKASLGHVKDLPKKDLAVDVEHDFTPKYEVIEGKKKLIAELKQAAKGVDSIYLAADPDREGEAICWHLQGRTGAEETGQTGDLPRDVQRNHGQRREEGVRQAARGERAIWWKRNRRAACSTGWSATRSPRCCGTKCAAGFPPAACKPSRLRLIVEREREIRAFQKQEYWTIDVALNAKKPRFSPPASTSAATKHRNRQ